MGICGTGISCSLPSDRCLLIRRCTGVTRRRTWRCSRCSGCRFSRSLWPVMSLCSGSRPGGVSASRSTSCIRCLSTRSPTGRPMGMRWLRPPATSSPSSRALALPLPPCVYRCDRQMPLVAALHPQALNAVAVRLAHVTAGEVGIDGGVGDTEGGFVGE